MKKLFIFTIITAICISLFPGCLAGSKNPNEITVGASATPHAEILRFLEEDYEALGYQLNIVTYTDYIMPNSSLANGDLDANFFQHLPYLEEYNKKSGTNLISAGAIHYEPMGIFANGISDLSQLQSGAKIILPADSSNQARALLLLASNNIIVLEENVELVNLTVLNVLNSNGFVLYPVEASSIPAQLKQSEKGTIAVINGNYAIGAGIDIATALATELSNSLGSTTYANILAIRKDDENRQAIIDLVNLLKSDKVKKYITDNYGGAVLPV